MAEGVVGVEEEVAGGHDVGAAGDGGDDAVLGVGAIGDGELGADDAFDAVGVAGGEVSGGGEPGGFGGGTGTAGAAVVGFSRAEDEVAGVGVFGGGNEFDVVNVGTVCAGDGLAFEGEADFPSEVGEFVGAPGVEGLLVVGADVEPVAAVGDVAVDGLAGGKGDGDVFGVAVGADIVEGDVTGGGAGGGDEPGGGFEGDWGGSVVAEVLEGFDDADGSVAAHAEGADVVEEGDGVLGFGVGGGEEEGSDEDVAATGLGEEATKEGEVGGAPGGEEFGEGGGAVGEFVGRIEDEAGGFSAGVGVEEGDPFHEPVFILTETV